MVSGKWLLYILFLLSVSIHLEYYSTTQSEIINGLLKNSWVNVYIHFTFMRDGCDRMKTSRCSHVLDTKLKKSPSIVNNLGFSAVVISILNMFHAKILFLFVEYQKFFIRAE